MSPSFRIRIVKKLNHHRWADQRSAFVVAVATKQRFQQKFSHVPLLNGDGDRIRTYNLHSNSMECLPLAPHHHTFHSFQLLTITQNLQRMIILSSLKTFVNNNF